jgi:hypothetical protein
MAMKKATRVKQKIPGRSRTGSALHPSGVLGSTVATEADVRRQFGLENEITIEGPAGPGFVQDTSCYHRATPPTHADRLILAVRFIS